MAQIGRFGCFALMILNISKACFGFASPIAFTLYPVVDSVLLGYCLVWYFCFHHNSLFRALALSILPSVLFLFSGIVSRSVLLTIAALIFTPCHIVISCKNALLSLQQKPSA